MVKSKPRLSPEYEKWMRDTKVAINHIFDEGSLQLHDFVKNRYPADRVGISFTENQLQQVYELRLEKQRAVLQSMIREIEENWNDTKSQEIRPTPLPVSVEPHLEKFTTYLDRKSEKETKRRLWIYLGALLAIQAGLAILTIIFGWALMEPWAYFIEVVAILGSYAYFAIMQREFSPKAIYNQLLESRKKKNYLEAELDETSHERLN